MASSYFLLLLLTIISTSIASDMSIISYDQTHVPERTHEEVVAMHESWMVEHGKTYNALGEKDRRLEIFKDNLKFIDQENAVPDRTYKLGLNRFADLTNDEYRMKYLGTRVNGTRTKVGSVKSDRYAPKVGESLPDSIDWREKGAVVAVKDQGSCGEFFFHFLIFFLICVLWIFV